MKNRYFSNIIPFFLFALMLFKVSSFHAYSHQDDTSDEIENCNTCLLAVESENSEYLFTATQTITPTISSLYFIQLPKINNLAVTPSFLRSNFFGRPPPSIG